MKIQNLKVDEIEVPETLLRTQISGEELIALQESIKQFGILEPLLVRKEGEKYILVAGYRRLTAAQNIGLDEVPCRILEVDKKTADILTVEENFKREEVNPLDFSKYLNYLHLQYGLKVSEISKLLGYSESYIYRMMKLVSLDDFLQEALDNGEITAEVALELSKLPTPELRFEYLEYARKQGAKASLVRKWVQDELMRAGLKPAPTPPPPQDVSQIEEQKEVLLKCEGCGKEYPSNGMLSMILCRECYNVIKRAIKISEEQDETTSGTQTH